MARSSYIWLVMSKQRVPLVAFTVKHELESFLNQHGRDVQIFRIRDGMTVKLPWMKFEIMEMMDPETLKPIEA
jgi:hypothetical protein